MPRVKDNVPKGKEYGYNGNLLIKKEGVKLPYTKEQVAEYQRCMNDPLYFIKNYIKVIHVDKGLIDIEPRGYQERMIRHVHESRFSIGHVGRQSGKTTTVAAYVLWFVCFNSEKDTFLLANKAATAREILNRVTGMLENLPYFLQPGCKILNKGSITFDNNSRIIAASTSSSSIRGMSAALILLDEFAHVQRDTEFYTSTYPVISSGTQSKVIIISTANGIGNMFHKIWEGAVRGVNEFKPFEVNWWEVPGRDEEWKRKTIANTSPEQFEQEYGLRFLGSSNTLLSANVLLGLKDNKPLYTKNDAKIYVEPVEEHKYIMTVDVCKGRGQDYSTFSIIDVTELPYRQVATYSNNTISPMLFPDIIHHYGTMYNDAYLLVEANDQGIVVCNALFYELEYENFYNDGFTSKKIGLEMNKRVKRIGCSNLRDLMEQNKLLIEDLTTIMELSTFEARGNSFEAAKGHHDDMVMTLVSFAWFVSTDLFSEFVNSNNTFREMLYSERISQIEDELVPVGIFSSMEDESDVQFQKILSK